MEKTATTKKGWYVTGRSENAAASIEARRCSSAKGASAQTEPASGGARHPCRIFNGGGGGLIAALLLAAAAFTACPNPGDDDEKQNVQPPAAQPNALANAVYGGLNPGGAWVTLAFKENKIAATETEAEKTEYKAVCAFSGDNTSNEYDYTYYDNRSGELKASGWTPGAFTVTEDGGTLTFSNFGGHGSAITFNRLRKPDLTVEASPADINGLTSDLRDSVWGGTTPAADGTSWLSITFRAKRTGDAESAQTGPNVVVVSYTHDSSTAVWDYAYDSATLTGAAFTNGHKTDGTAMTWNPGAYTISADGNTLTFSSFMGAERSFTRYYQTPPEAAPPAPSAVTLTAANGKLTAAWPAAADATGYEVYWHTADDTANIPAANKIEVTTTSADITVLTNNTYYYVWVKAKNSKGTSDFSSVKSIMYPSIVKVWAFSSFAYLQKSDGTLWSTGGNTYGQLGLGVLGADADKTKFVQVKDASGVPITGVKKIVENLNAVRLLKNDGTLWGVGRNANSARGDTDTASKSNFIPLTMEDGTTPMTGISDIGGWLAIKDGELYVAGENNATYKALGFERSGHQAGFVKVVTDTDGNTINNVAAVFGSRTASFFVKTNGEVWACGYNVNGNLGLGNAETPVVKFTKVVGLTNVKDIQISGVNAVFALKQDGSFWGAGQNSNLLMTTTGNTVEFTQLKWDDGTLITGIKEIAVGRLLKEDGTVWTTNGFAAGMNTIINPPTIFQVKDLFENILTGVSAIATTSTSTIYVLNDGRGLTAGGSSALGTGRTDIPDTGLRLEDLDDLTPNLILFE